VKTHDTIEAEIDKIRIDIYEKTKHMSDSEFLDYFRKIGENAAKKYGFKLVESLGSNNVEKSHGSE
jgi:hypothetical protein